MIIVAGRASDFATAENFTSQLSSTTIQLACGKAAACGQGGSKCNPHASVNFDWPTTRLLPEQRLWATWQQILPATQLRGEAAADRRGHD